MEKNTDFFITVYLLNIVGLWPVSDRATGGRRSETGPSYPKLLRRYIRDLKIPADMT
jgi:hypothetical protein